MVWQSLSAAAGLSGAYRDRKYLLYTLPATVLAEDIAGLAKKNRVCSAGGPLRVRTATIIFERKVNLSHNFQCSTERSSCYMVLHTGMIACLSQLVSVILLAYLVCPST